MLRTKKPRAVAGANTQSDILFSILESLDELEKNEDKVIQQELNNPLHNKSSVRSLHNSRSRASNIQINESTIEERAVSRGDRLNHRKQNMLSQLEQLKKDLSHLKGEKEEVRRKVCRIGHEHDNMCERIHHDPRKQIKLMKKRLKEALLRSENDQIIEDTLGKTTTQLTITHDQLEQNIKKLEKIHKKRFGEGSGIDRSHSVYGEKNSSRESLFHKPITSRNNNLSLLGLIGDENEERSDIHNEVQAMLKKEKELLEACDKNQESEMQRAIRMLKFFTLYRYRLKKMAKRDHDGNLSRSSLGSYRKLPIDDEVRRKLLGGSPEPKNLLFLEDSLPDGEDPDPDVEDEDSIIQNPNIFLTHSMSPSPDRHNSTDPYRNLTNKKEKQKITLNIKLPRSKLEGLKNIQTYVQTRDKETNSNALNSVEKTIDITYLTENVSIKKKSKYRRNKVFNLSRRARNQNSLGGKKPSATNSTTIPDHLTNLPSNTSNQNNNTGLGRGSFRLNPLTSVKSPEFSNGYSMNFDRRKNMRFIFMGNPNYEYNFADVKHYDHFVKYNPTNDFIITRLGFYCRSNQILRVDVDYGTQTQECLFTHMMFRYKPPPAQNLMIEEAIFRDGDAIKSISCTFTEAIHAVRILSRDRIVFKINSKKAKHGKQTYDVWHDFEDYEEIAYINSGFMKKSGELAYLKIYMKEN